MDLSVNKGAANKTTSFIVNSSDYKQSLNDQSRVDALENSLLNALNPTNEPIIPSFLTSVGTKEVKNNIASTSIKDETTFNNAFPGLPSIANVNNKPSPLGAISWNGIFPLSIPNNTFKLPINISQGNVSKEVEVKVTTSDFSPEDENDVRLVWEDIKNTLLNKKEFSSPDNTHKLDGRWIAHSFNNLKNNELTFNDLFPSLPDISAIDIRGTKVYWNYTRVQGTKGARIDIIIYITKGSQQKTIDFKIKASDYIQ